MAARFNGPPLLSSKCGVNVPRNILVTVILVTVPIPRGPRRGRVLRGSRFVVIDFFN